MKKFIFLLILLAIPVSAKASSVGIVCSSTSVYVGDTFTCDIVGYSNIVSGVSGNISTTNLDISSFEKVNCSIGNVTNNEFTCVDEERSNSLTFARYRFVAKSAGTAKITLSGATLVIEDFDEVSVGNAVQTINVSVRQQNNPSPSPSTSPQPSSSPKPSTSPKASSTPTASQTPVKEDKENNVLPKEESGSNNTTGKANEVVPTKPVGDSRNNLITFLAIEGVKLDFDPNIHTYNLSVDNSMSKLTFEYDTTSVEAIVSVINDELEVGENECHVVAKLNGVEQDYVFYVTRKAAKSHSYDTMLAGTFLAVSVIIFCASLGYSLKNR